MLNKVQIIGNLGQDPEARSFQNGGEVVNLSVATSQKWKDKNTGETREKTEWHRIAIFSEVGCRYAKQYLRKGSKVYIEGQLETRKWQAQDGTDRYSTEIVVRPYSGTVQGLDRPPQNGQQQPQGGHSGGAGPGGYQDDRSTYGGDQRGHQGGHGGGQSYDDEIPF